MYIKITISFTMEVFTSLPLAYIDDYVSYLNHKLTAITKWSGNFLVFYKNLGRQLVRHRH